MINEVQHILSDITYLCGYLFQKRNTNNNLLDLLLRLKKSENIIDRITDPLTKIDNWNWGKIITKESYRNEKTEGPFNYDFFVKEKETTNIAILLTENREIAKLFLEIIQESDKNFYPIRINTDKIIHFMLNAKGEENEYIITYLHSKVAGMQDRLNSISIYGRDVIRSTLFGEFKNNFEPISCGIGVEENSFSGYNEVARISNDGYVSFNSKNVEVFNSIKKVITFVKKANGFIYT